MPIEELTEKKEKYVCVLCVQVCVYVDIMMTMIMPLCYFIYRLSFIKPFQTYHLSWFSKIMQQLNDLHELGKERPEVIPANLEHGLRQSTKTLSFLSDKPGVIIIPTSWVTVRIKMESVWTECFAYCLVYSNSPAELSCYLVARVILQEPCEARSPGTLILFAEEAARYRGLIRRAQRHAPAGCGILCLVPTSVPACPAALQTGPSVRITWRAS